MPLNAAEAEKRLLSFRVPHEKRGRAWAFMESSLKLGDVKPHSDGYRLKVGQAVAALNILNRRTTLTGIAGPLKPALENALKIAAKLPYQTHSSRVPFRARNITGATEMNLGRMVTYCARLRDTYDQPIEWFAEWCGYIERNLHEVIGLDVLLAAEIDSGNEQVLDTLLQSIDGRHPIGIISRTGVRALARCKKPAAWQGVEKLLLGAERAEGLRQSIIECVDELNPIVFERFVRLVIEHNLLRFSSVFRAFLTWFPGLIPEGKQPPAEQVLLRLLEFMRDPGLNPDPTFADTYLRLWTDAYEDAAIAIRRGKKLFASKDVDVRRAVASIASTIGLTTTGPLIDAVLRDPDLRVNVYGVAYLEGLKAGAYASGLQPLVLELAKRWPLNGSDGVPRTRKDVWDVALRHAPPENLPLFFENLDELSADSRRRLAMHLGEIKDARLRKSMALMLAGDKSDSVRRVAFQSLSSFPISAEDAPELEALLSRKAADIRTAVLVSLARQPGQGVLESAQRLSTSVNANQRRAGAELAARLAKGGISGPSSLVPPKSVEVAPVQGSVNDLFGLLKLHEISFAPRPVPVLHQTLYTPGAIAILQEFDDYILARKAEVVKAFINGWTDEELPVGNLVSKNLKKHYCDDLENEKPLPFVAEVVDWYRSRLTDTKGGREDLLRAQIISEFASPHQNKLPSDLAETLTKHMSDLPRHLSATQGLLERICQGMTLPPTVLLDLISNQIAESAEDLYEIMRTHSRENEHSWRKRKSLSVLCRRLEALAIKGEGFSVEDWRRAYVLYRYIDEPSGSKARIAVEELHEEMRSRADADPFWYNREVESRRQLSIPFREPVPLVFVNRAFEIGACNKSEVLDQIRFELGKVTEKQKTLNRAVKEIVQELVDRVVEIEAQRGDLIGEASRYAGDIKGMIHLKHVITLLGSGVPLARTDSYHMSGTYSRAKSFTRLLAYSRPAPDESVEECGAALRELKAKPERLVEFAMLSPNWAACVEIALGWEGFEDAVWWLHAHTKEEVWGVPDDIRSVWAGAISERTPLSATQLENGCCDPAWFHRFRGKLDDKQWKLLDRNAKFASSGSGHARAQLFARALSGDLTGPELIGLIQSKRNPNHVRALGLIPLGPDSKAEIRERYLLLQEFLNGSRQFGSARQATEKLAFEIAIENLASTAGYPDALRLTWAMEASEVQDLNGEGLRSSVGDLSLRLYFDPLGQPTIEAAKGGKLLKDIPAAEKKRPEVKAFTDRRSHLKKQLARMRLSLEQAMQRGDRFHADELRSLVEHPGLRPLLQNLVFIGESGVAGFPDEEGRVGEEGGILRIAHPYDLLLRRDWPEWQARVFQEERVQPFKQVFRELYVLTDAEKSQSSLTRYGGHQVRPAQAMAILGKRGWIARHEEGVSKTYHDLDITARITTDFVGYTPADIEGATLEGLDFTRGKDWRPIPLSEIPPLVFSETVRDLDLIVSVASVAGIDPDASESTVEMRQHVIEQTARLLRLDNISFIPRHVTVRGRLAEYTVNLGSGTVHQRARGELVIIAVRQPQRGRLFLPFVDDDPRTAEIVSKVILLSRDDEIKDPTILVQILGG